MEVREPSAKYLVKPGYKQSDLGHIPIDWEVLSLGHIADCLIGLTYSPKDVRDFGTLVLRSSNVQNGRLSFDDCVFVDMDLPNRVITEHGDILVCVRNGSSRLIGKCAVVDDRAAGSAFGAFMAVLRSSASAFLFQQFQSEILKRQISEGLGATINQITNRDMAAFRVVWPPDSNERQVIAEALSDADALIESLEQLLTKKRQIKQGAMQELLTGQRRLPGFGGEWVNRKIAEIADTDPENLSSDTNLDFTFNYISLEDVDKGQLRSYSEIVFLDAPSRARRKIRSGDVLVSTVRPNLKSHLLFDREGDAWVCSTGFCVVRCRKGVSHDGFIFAHMFAFVLNSQIEMLLTGSNYPAINSRDVGSLTLPMPAYEEQTAIASVLSAMDAEITDLETQLHKTRQLKQGMMQELLTGRIRLV